MKTLVPVCKILLVAFILLGIGNQTLAQNVAITDEDSHSPDANAMLDIYSLNKGLLIPRVDLISDNDPIAGVKEQGLLVWNNSTAGDYSEVGFYYWNGGDWEMVGSNNVFENGLSQSGNSIGLGGTLNKATTVNLSNYNMSINLNGSGNFNVLDNGVSALYINNEGNIGVGTTSPSHKLVVDGNLSVGDNLIIESTSNYGKYRNLATYSASTTSGAFVINTNQTTATMFVMKITGYFYSGPGPYEITLKGYWNGSSCANGSYLLLGPDNFPVRVARNTSGAMAVILGEEGTSYSHPKFTVTEYFQGHTAPNPSFADDWVITQETDLGSYENMVELQNSTANPNYYGNDYIDDLEDQIIAQDLWTRTGSTTYLKNTTDKMGIGTTSPLGVLHVRSTNSNTSGTDGSFIDVHNYYNSYSVLSGIRFINGSTISPKGAIFYQDKASFGRGNIIFANRNYQNSTNVTVADARMIINYKGDVGVGIGDSDPTSRLTVQGNSSGLTDDPLFEVKNNDGETVFAVFNEGVRIWVDDQPGKAAGSRGGFAVGGFTTGKGETNEFLRVTPDSVRVYIDADQAKAAGSRGGFAVGGFTTGKSNAINLMQLTRENYFIGHESGLNTTGIHNFFAGYQAGQENTSGFSNVLIGPEAGKSNTEGKRNVMIGHLAGKSNIGDNAHYTIGHDNIYIGTQAGQSITSGEHNTLIGSQSGYNGSGTKNTFVGAFTGLAASGTSNAYFGVDAGRFNASGNRNVFLGTTAGMNFNNGSNNTFVGYGAGYYKTSGTGNVFLGYTAGANEAGSYKLYIDNSTTASPLIYGDFSSDYLGFNAKVGVHTHTPQTWVQINKTDDASLTNGSGVFQIGSMYGANILMDGNEIMARNNGGTSNLYLQHSGGNVYIGGVLVQTSDKQLKKDITKLKYGLDEILKLNPVDYNWIDRENTKKSIGLLAQEVQPIFNELVHVSEEDDMLGIDYTGLIPVLINAIKEQQMQIDKLKDNISNKNQELEELKQALLKIAEIEKQLNELKLNSGK